MNSITFLPRKWESRTGSPSRVGRMKSGKGLAMSILWITAVFLLYEVHRERRTASLYLERSTYALKAHGNPVSLHYNRSNLLSAR